MKKLTYVLAILSLMALCIPATSFAKPRPDLDKEIADATMKFKSEMKDGEDILSSAKGYLIFPEVTKAGIGIGGEYGKGALVVDGEIVEYYSTKAASVGAQLGVETKSLILTFNTDTALKDFKESKGWEIGVDGSVTVANVGKEGSINTTTTMNKPVVAYVYGKEGLMADVSLQGSKITKLDS